LQPDGQNDNGWDQGLLFLNPSQVWLQPPGYVTQMLAGNAESQLVYSQVQSRGDVLDVTAKRSSDSKTLVLQVVNLSEQSIPSTIALDGFKVSNPVSTAQELAGPLDTVNTAQEPDALVLREIDWPNKFTNGSTSYTFKPYSLTVLSFR
jgi:alpha-L-arabinofuranosidase